MLSTRAPPANEFGGKMLPRPGRQAWDENTGSCHLRLASSHLPLPGGTTSRMTADPTLESGWLCELIHTELPDVCLPQGWLEAERTCWVCKSSHPSADSRLKHSAVGDGEVFPLVFGPQDPPQPLPTSLSFLIQVGTHVGTEQFWEALQSKCWVLDPFSENDLHHTRTF